MTQRVIDYFTNYLLKQGPTIVLLACAVWYFSSENRQMSEEIRACNQSIIDMYRTDRIQLQEIISNNTRALQEIKFLRQ